VGQISVDDPVDGAWPSSKTLALLEELADVGAVALGDARELQTVSEERKILRFLTESAMTGVLIIEEGEARYVNARACDLLGYEEDDLRSLNPWWQVIHPDDLPLVWASDGHPPSVRGTIRAIRRDGRLIWVASCAYPMEPLASGAFVLHFYDVTDHVETEALLKEKALRDPLTGLLNRGYFEDAILTEIERSRRHKRPLTLMMADLARFKLVNDRLGHQEGDRILSGVASVLRSQLRDSDWVVRYGGDEFLLVLPETGAELEALEARLKVAVETWHSSSDSGIAVGIDFGWATWTPKHDRGSAELVREADAMLYERKAERYPGQVAYGKGSGCCRVRSSV
jgi:diguanylate cyclase (GGDEF)-like protein/PAS domain S-box-containing protein